MHTHNFERSALLRQRVTTPEETPSERHLREQRSLQVARQMMSNGCCANTVMRYTGLSDEQLHKLYL